MAKGEKAGRKMVKSNTNQFISINLSSTWIAVLLFGLDVLCVFLSSLTNSGYTFNQFRETVRAFLINVFVLRQY